MVSYFDSRDKTVIYLNASSDIQAYSNVNKFIEENIEEIMLCYEERGVFFFSIKYWADFFKSNYTYLSPDRTPTSYDEDPFMHYIEKLCSINRTFSLSASDITSAIENRYDFEIVTTTLCTVHGTISSCPIENITFQSLSLSVNMEYFREHALMVSNIDNRLYNYHVINTYLNIDLDTQDDYDLDVDKIVSEIDERIKLLKDRGLYYILRDVIQPKLLTSPSSVLITADYRIILTDYNNMEITLYPLAKALYFLYLRHSDAIAVVDLHKYKSELLKIYSAITHFDDYGKIMLGIDNLVNPKSASVRENCSRIKRAFIDKMTNDIASTYYIHGGHTNKKYIFLNRSMVTWECRF